MASLLVTRPRHDNLTTYLYYWADAVVTLAKEKDFKIYDLAGDKAIQKEFISYMKKRKPDLLFLNGHGNENTLGGHDDDPILINGINHTVTASAIVYAISCSCASNLGPACVSAGAKAFVGYNRPYFLFTDDSSSTHPLNDSVAKLFLEPSNLLMTALIKGKSVGDAYGKSRENLIKKFRYAISSQATQDQRDVAPNLYFNLQSFVVHGDLDATVY